MKKPDETTKRSSIPTYVNFILYLGLTLADVVLVLLSAEPSLLRTDRFLILQSLLISRLIICLLTHKISQIQLNPTLARQWLSNVFTS